MTKVILAILALVFACLFVPSTALPSVLSHSVSPQAKPNLPRTLLGKPYRGHWNSPGCLPARWTLVTDRNNVDCDADPDHASAHEGQIVNSGWTQTEMNTSPRVPMLPLVLNTFSESKPARLRLMKSKRPMQYVDGTPPPKKAQSDGINLGDEVEQLQSPDISRPEEKQELRKVSMPARRSKRLYDRGEWKSRLFEEY